MKTFMDNTFIDDIQQFTEQQSVRRMYQSLVKIFIDFVRFQKDGMPTNIYTLLNDIEALFELLEIMERHEGTLK